MYELRHSSLVIVADEQQNIVYCGDNSLSLLGYTREEMHDRKLADLMDSRKARVHQYHIDNYVENGSVREDVGRFEAIMKDGKRVEVNVWIPGKYAFKIDGKSFIVGALWDAKVIDTFNSLQQQQKMMNLKIENISNELLEGIEDIKDIILKGLGYKQAIDEKGNQTIIQIENKGGDANGDVNIDSKTNVDGANNVSNETNIN